MTSGSAEGILTFPCYPGHGMLCMHSVFACRPLVQRRCQRLYPNATGIQSVDHLVCLLHCRKAPSAGGTCFFFCSALHLTRPSTLRPPFAVPCFSRRPCVCTRVLDGVPIQQMVPPCSTPPPQNSRVLQCSLRRPRSAHHVLVSLRMRLESPAGVTLAVFTRHAQGTGNWKM